ncbi:hypothetical protein NQ315_002157 [Exocentrus adspersus]|uniref:THAP-type domain-containing protein n=1 Tax=Exocentrus adspersus TaxID=1586481 RepID=A0AAV8W061_9CUCU|nr:hypothetical protein NQ315_002157 [Exocentrus adspersus]
MTGDKKKAGNVCSYRNCKNKSYNSANRMYRFPTDVERAKSWLTACDRLDLLDLVGSLHKGYRICEAHFPPRMFKKGKKQLLRRDAVPINFVPNSVPTSSSSTIIIPEVPTTSILRKLLEPSSSCGDNSLIKTELIEFETIPVDSPTTGDNSSIKIETSPVSSPTQCVPISHAVPLRISRKERLRQINRTLRLENQALKRQNQDLRNKNTNLEKALRNELEKPVTFDQYKCMTYAICESKELADFIVAQVSKPMKSSRHRRYSDEFKEFVFS